MQPVLDWAVGHINSGSMVIIFVHNIVIIDLNFMTNASLGINTS